MKKFPVNFVAVALLLAGLSARAAEDPLAGARAALAAGDAHAAYAALAPLSDAQAGNVDFDLLFGQAALGAGKPADALFAFERVLDADPNNATAKNGMAEAYQRSAKNKAAGTTDVLKTQYNIFVETGVGFDSNSSSALSDDQVIVPTDNNGDGLADGSTRILGRAREQDSTLWMVNAGFKFFNPFSKHWLLFGGATLGHRLVVDSDQLSQLNANGNLGIGYITGRDQYRLSLRGTKSVVGGNGFRDTIGPQLMWIRNIDSHNVVSAFVRYEFVHFPDQDRRDVNRAWGGAYWSHLFDNPYKPRLTLQGFGGNENELSSTNSHIGRDFYGASLYGEFDLNQKTKPYAQVYYKHSDYDGTDPIFLVSREDNFYDFSAGLHYQLNKLITVRPEIRYSTNDSDLVLTDYDRWSGMVMFRSDF